MNLLVVGGGGREHTIIKKLNENPAVETIYALPGNGGIAADAICVPEIGAKDIPAIVETQKKPLNTVCRYVKKGGTLVYSTCSILPEENMLQVKAFLESHPEFEVIDLPKTFPEELRKLQGSHGLQLLGCRDGVEGFFIARMRRVR